MKKLHLIILLLPFWIGAQGAMPSGARSGGMLNASTTINDNWSYFNNPGALGKVASISAGISYENRYLLSDLQRQSLAIAVPTKFGVFSVGAIHQGNATYKNFRSGLGYAMKLADHFSAGVQFNYQGLHLPNYYGSSHTVTAEAGILVNINPKWNFGASLFNLGQNKLSEFKDDRYNTTLRIGAGFLPSKSVTILAEIWKDIDGPVSFKGALEYEAFKNFNLRLGVGNQPTAFAFGFGYRWKEFSIDLATAYHQVLGFSPQLSFTYEKSKAK
jgi:hypothetical protein